MLSDNSQNNLLHHFIGRQSDTNRSFPSLFQTRPTSSTRFTFSLALFTAKPLKNSLSPQQTSRVRSSATNPGSTRLKHKLCREGCGSIKMAPKTQPGNHGTFTPLSPQSCQNHLNLPQMPSGGGGWGRVLLNEATGEPAAVKPGLFLTCVPVSGSGAGLGGLFIDADRRARQVLRGSANTVGTAAPRAGGGHQGDPASPHTRCAQRYHFGPKKDHFWQENTSDNTPHCVGGTADYVMTSRAQNHPTQTRSSPILDADRESPTPKVIGKRLMGESVVPPFPSWKNPPAA